MKWAADNMIPRDEPETVDTTGRPIRPQLVEAWQQRVAAADDAAEFPADRSRPAVLGRECHRSLRPVAELISPTRQPVDSLVAAWAIFFAKACGSTDGRTTIVVAEHEGDHRKGSLLNVEIDDLQTSSAFVDDIAQIRRIESERGAVEFLDLADALGLTNRTDRNPLCSTAAGPAGPPSDDDSADACAAAGNELTTPDLQLTWIWSQDSGIDAVEIAGSAALFEADRVERIADQFMTLLHSMVTNPDAELRNLAWVPDTEVELITSWQGQTSEPGNPLLGHRFSDLVPQWPHRTAVSFGDTVWSYTELDTWSNRLATALRDHGVGNDSIVAIRMERSIELIASLIAVLKAGGAYLPVDPTYPPARQRHMLEHADVSVILTDSANAQPDDSAIVVVVDDPQADFHRSSAELVSSEGDGSELGYVIYTSGSTGTPKAVGMPIRALANLIDWQLDQPEFEFGRRTLQFSSPSFDVSFQEIMSTLLSGGTLVLIEEAVRRDPRALHQHIIEHGVERIFLPNVALRGLADVAAATGTAAALPLREVYTAGEQLRVDDVMRSLFEQLPKSRLANHYGPSETHVSTAHVLSEQVGDWPLLPPIGAPIANSVAEVLDPAGRRVPVGIPGELWHGGRCLARGYIGNPEATAERFVPDPFRPGETLYRTGDQVRWTGQGELEFLGRLDHQVKFRGFRIEPAEIATVLSAIDGVGHCFVAVRDVAGAGSRLVAYVQLDDPALAISDLRHRAAETLPDYMVPTHYVQLDTIPLTSSGKVDIEAMPAPTFNRGALDNAFIAPRNPVEEAIQSMWQSLLGTDGIGVLDDFFELGGDSLMAVEMFAMIGERFGVELPLGALAQEPTIAGLAAQVTTAGVGVDEFNVVVPIKIGGSRTPLFCVHGGSGNVASFPRLARMLDPDQPFYGLQWPGLRYGRFPRTMKATAEQYVAKIKEVQPSGPYRLAGQCIGGLIANEMARQLVEAGESVDFVVLYDSPMLYSPAYRAAASVPAVPSPLRPVALRALSVAVGLLRFAKGRFVEGPSPRLGVLKTRVRRALGRRVPRNDLFMHAASVMCDIAWRHRPPSVDGVKTILIHSGIDNAGAMSLTGRWTDQMLGWRHRLGPNFEAHQVPGGHNDLLYSPDGVNILKDLLAERD